jgi:copper chaperone CopZ
MRTASLIVSAALASAIVLAGCKSRSARSEQRAASANQAEMKTVVMSVEGMSCVACVARVKKALKDIDGVSDVEVSLVERNARIRSAPSKLSPNQLVAAVNGLGYRAGPPAEVR